VLDCVSPVVRPSATHDPFSRTPAPFDGFASEVGRRRLLLAAFDGETVVGTVQVSSRSRRTSRTAA
jgi:hypothetical protein